MIRKVYKAANNNRLLWLVAYIATYILQHTTISRQITYADLLNLAEDTLLRYSTIRPSGIRTWISWEADRDSCRPQITETRDLRIVRSRPSADLLQVEVEWNNFVF